MQSSLLLPANVENRLRNWWAFGDQKTPCIIGSALKPGASIPDTNDLNQFWTDTDFVHRRAMAIVDQTDWFGVGVPYHYVDQGSSAMAGVLGCPLEFIDKETVWAHERCTSLDEVFGIQWKPDSPIYRRIRDITARSAAQAKGHHHVGLFALEGMTDLLAALYGLENFLMDLCDKPEEVGKAMAHLKTIWMQAFRDISSVASAHGNRGGIGWVGVWAPGSTFPLQEDVAYNMSPDMFREFCIPHIRDQVAVLDYPFFHLDGVGMIPHLDALLEIKELKAIQWQPGAGKERLDQWYELIRKILAAGKSVQVYAKPDEVPALVHAVGARGLLVILSGARRDEIESLLDVYPQ